MLKVDKISVMNMENAIRGARNPMNSWARMDSFYDEQGNFVLGENDLSLARRLAVAGSDHRKFLRQIMVSMDITAPLYWWKEFDTYKVGTVANSCSTMHKIHDKEFTLEDFSHEHLFNWDDQENNMIPGADRILLSSEEILNAYVIPILNTSRSEYLKTKDKRYWWQMIQLLPSSYNQKRTVMLSYETLANIYEWRRNHKLDEWREMCKWIESLPYSEIITQPIVEKDSMVKIKTVVPEIVAYLDYEGEKVPDYRCPECGFGVAEDYIGCPHCMSKLDWENVKKPDEGEFRELSGKEK